MAKKGNVQAEESAPKVSELLEEGDVVALTPSALRIGRLKSMTPRLLHKIGHPNEFVVLTSFKSDKGEDCLTLWPCCNRFTDRESGKQTCTGHQTVYFEKVGNIRTPKKGDKSASLVLPFIGEVFGIDYQEDENNPDFRVNLGGLKGSVTGVLAKAVKKFAEDNKII